MGCPPPAKFFHPNISLRNHCKRMVGWDAKRLAVGAECVRMRAPRRTARHSTGRSHALWRSRRRRRRHSATNRFVYIYIYTYILDLLLFNMNGFTMLTWIVFHIKLCMQTTAWLNSLDGRSTSALQSNNISQIFVRPSEAATINNDHS